MGESEISTRATRTANRVRRVAGALVGATALGASMFVIGTPAAHAAACYGSGCDGLDPQATGCYADAITPAGAGTIWAGGVKLELRYSPSCGANWARMTPGQFGWHFYVHNANGAYHDSTGLGESSTWTAMVDGTVAAQACFDTAGCTSWY
jgi:hypothetical protein